MLKIYVQEKHRTIEVPEKWDELTDDQYVYCMMLINRLNQGEINIQDFKTHLNLYLFSFQKIKDENLKKRGKFNENLELLNYHVRFPFKIEYTNKKLLGTCSKELQEKLKKFEPTEIYEKEFREELESKINQFYIKDKMGNYTLDGKYVLDLQINRNPIKYIQTRQKKLYGCIYEVLENGIIHTDITAEEFVDANEYYRMYAITGKERDLNYLISVLYREKHKGKRLPYNTVVSQGNVVDFKRTSKAEKFGIFLFFESMMRYLLNHPVYSIIWTKEEGPDEKRNQNQNKINLGMGGILLDLAEKIGGLEQVKNMNLTEYLSLLVKNKIDYIKFLKEHDTTEADICKKAGISMKQLKMIA